jgi:hypothetical protein
MGLSVIPTEVEGSLFLFASRSRDRRVDNLRRISPNDTTHMPYNYLGE